MQKKQLVIMCVQVLWFTYIYRKYKEVFVCYWRKITSFGFAQTARPAWDQVQGPDIVSIAPDAKDRATLVVSFDLVTATEGADKAVVEMLDSTGKIIQSKNVGKSKKVTKTAKFTPETSGTYTFRVRALRNKVTEEKVSAPVEYKFLFPLSLPDVSIRNTDYGIFDVKWNPVNEAEKYLVKVTEKDSGKLVKMQIKHKLKLLLYWI